MTVAETVRLAKLRLEPVAGEESLQQAKLLAGCGGHWSKSRRADGVIPGWT
jgi:hypothetical protein